MRFIGQTIIDVDKENTMKCQNCPCGPACTCIICTCKTSN